MENTNNTQGGGVYISPNLKKTSVVLTKEGVEIPVKTPKEKAEALRANRNK